MKPRFQIICPCGTKKYFTQGAAVQYYKDKLRTCEGVSLWEYKDIGYGEEWVSTNRKDKDQ